MTSRWHFIQLQVGRRDNFCKMKHNQSEEAAGEVWDAIRLNARCRFTKSNGNMVEEVYFEAVGSYQ